MAGYFIIFSVFFRETGTIESGLPIQKRNKALKQIIRSLADQTQFPALPLTN
jgi:hypothetical protein